jgi:hypothetical protein
MSMWLMKAQTNVIMNWVFSDYPTLRGSLPKMLDVDLPPWRRQ